MGIDIERLDTHTDDETRRDKTRRYGTTGFESPAADYLRESVDLSRRLITNRTATFIYRMASDAMIHEGIDPGDIVVFDRSLNHVHGDVVVAICDQTYLCRRYNEVRMGNRIQMTLQAANPQYPDQMIMEGDSTFICGVVTSIIKLKHRARP